MMSDAVADETDHSLPTDNDEMSKQNPLEEDNSELLKYSIDISSDNDESSSDVHEISDSPTSIGPPGQNKQNGCNKNISWSDIDSSESDNDDEDDQEKHLSNMIHCILNDKIQPEFYEKWPNLLLFHSQSPTKISPLQLDEILFLKAADMLIHHHDLGKQMFEANYLSSELNGWVDKFLKLQQYVSVLKKKVRRMEKERLPPVPTVHYVRSVGTYVNMPMIKNTAPATTPNTDPIIITID